MRVHPGRLSSLSGRTVGAQRSGSCCVRQGLVVVLESGLLVHHVQLEALLHLGTPNEASDGILLVLFFCFCVLHESCFQKKVFQHNLPNRMRDTHAKTSGLAIEEVVVVE